MKFQTIKTEDVMYPLIGYVSSISFFSFLELIGTLVMALLIGIFGAIGGWIFKKYVNPWLDRKFKK